MSRKEWLHMDYGSPMDMAISEIFLSNHHCDGRPAYLSNALTGQYSGIPYRRFDYTYDVLFECMKCRHRFTVHVKDTEMEKIPAFPRWAYDSMLEALRENGCHHNARLLLSPVLRDEKSERIRLVICRTCHHRARFEW